MAAAQVPGNERGMEHISQRCRIIENKLGQILDILEGRAGEAWRLVNIEREHYLRQDITAMFKCPVSLDLVRFPAIVCPSCGRIIGCAACVVQIVYLSKIHQLKNSINNFNCIMKVSNHIKRINR